MQATRETPLGSRESAAPLLDLPVELVHNIMETLPPASLAALRLTCSALAVLGIEHLVEDTFLVYKLDCFARLDKISAHPVVSKTIKSLHYQADRLRSRSHFADWNKERFVLVSKEDRAFGRESLPRAVKDALDNGQPLESRRRMYDWFTGLKGKFTRTELRAAYGCHCALVTEQMTINTRQSDVRHLTTMFSNCPNLNTVVFSTSHGPRGSRSDMRKFAFAECHVEPYGDIEMTAEGNDQFVGLCQALRAADRKLKTLVVSNLGFKMFETKSEHELQMVQDVVGDLHELRISFATLTNEVQRETLNAYASRVDDCRNVFDRGPLAKMLSSAHNLRVLKICAPQCAPSEPTISFVGSVGQRTWPRLREFGVSGMRCTEDELVGFLLRHSEKLRRLSMSNIELTEGTWASAFKRIACRFPKLRKLKISGDFDSEDNVTIVGQPERPELECEEPGSTLNCFDHIADAVATFVKHGGRYEEHMAAAHRRKTKHGFPEVSLPYPDYEYDSDGSYVDYMSDQLDTII